MPQRSLDNIIDFLPEEIRLRDGNVMTQLEKSFRMNDLGQEQDDVPIGFEVE